MDVLLINPANSVFTGSTTLPLGIAYLASSLERDGHRVEVLDMCVDDTDAGKKIDGFDLVGISSCTPSIKTAWKLSALAREKGKTVVLGGPHPTALPDESLEYADIIVRKEGEETFREICGEKNPGDILGISYKQDGKVVHNPDRPFTKDLDSLPFPARHLFKRDRYRSEMRRHNIVGDILTSRGCPNNCIFCYKAIFGSIYRTRSPKNVVDEWEQLLGMGYKEIGIVDDNFSVNKKRAIEICDMILERGLKVDWTATGGLRVDCVSDELFTAMRRSGCYRVSLGVESGSQYILDKIRKNTKLDQIRNAVKKAKSHGFEVHLFFMIGNLYETKETIQQTIDFAKELDGDYAQFTIAAPYPATEMYDIIKREGKLLVNDWDEYSSYERKCYFEHGNINSDFVSSMHKKAYMQYYLRPRIMLRLLKKHGLSTVKGLKLIK